MADQDQAGATGRHRAQALVEELRQRVAIQDITLTDRAADEIERLSERVWWFEQAGGVTMAIRIHSLMRELEQAKAALAAAEIAARAEEREAREAEVEELGTALTMARTELDDCYRQIAALRARGEEDAK